MPISTSFALCKQNKMKIKKCKGHCTCFQLQSKDELNNRVVIIVCVRYNKKKRTRCITFWKISKFCIIFSQSYIELQSSNKIRAVTKQILILEAKSLRIQHRKMAQTARFPSWYKHKHGSKKENLLFSSLSPSFICVAFLSSNSSIW